MAEKNFELEILTPLKPVYQGEVESLIATGVDGLFGVLVNHASMLSGLGFGPMLIRQATGGEKWFLLSDGFFEIKNNKATILIDTAESKEEIDTKRAEDALQRAKNRLAGKNEEQVDIARAEAALQRAIARVSLARK